MLVLMLVSMTVGVQQDNLLLVNNLPTCNIGVMSDRNICGREITAFTIIPPPEFDQTSRRLQLMFPTLSIEQRKLSVKLEGTCRAFIVDGQRRSGPCLRDGLSEIADTFRSGGDPCQFCNSNQSDSIRIAEALHRA